MSRQTRDGAAETVSRDQILRHERGQRNIHFPCSANHEQGWQPYPVDPFSCYMCDHTLNDTAVYYSNSIYNIIRLYLSCLYSSNSDNAAILSHLYYNIISSVSVLNSITTSSILRCIYIYQVYIIYAKCSNPIFFLIIGLLGETILNTVLHVL